MKKIILYVCVAFSSGLLFTNLYNSIVNAANWESNVPVSITATREFFTVANPGTFYQLIDPTNLVLTLVAIALLWKSTVIRNYLLVALLLYVSAIILTFAYFYPRNEIMFMSARLPDTETLKRAAMEWGNMKWVRSFIWLAGLFCTFSALNKYVTAR